MKKHVLGAVFLLGAGGCSLFTVKTDPFPVLDVRADKPPPPPSRVVLTDSSITISDKVQFATGKADVLEASFGLLDEVVKVMQDNEQIELVQVEGHTDSTGSAAFNRKLSQQRAESVKKYIVSKGIKASRLTAKGFGPDKPVAPGTDPASLEQNRRVEFNIVKQGPKKTVVQDD